MNTFEKEVNKCIKKIKNYPKGFEFTINYSQIPTTEKENGMHFVLDKACKMGLIECVAIGHSLADLRGESGRFCTEKTYRRI